MANKKIVIIGNTYQVFAICQVLFEALYVY